MRERQSKFHFKLPAISLKFPDLDTQKREIKFEEGSRVVAFAWLGFHPPPGRVTTLSLTSVL